MSDSCTTPTTWTAQVFCQKCQMEVEVDMSTVSQDILKPENAGYVEVSGMATGRHFCTSAFASIESYCPGQIQDLAPLHPEWEGSHSFALPTGQLIPCQ